MKPVKGQKHFGDLVAFKKLGKRGAGVGGQER